MAKKKPAPTEIITQEIVVNEPEQQDPTQILTMSTTITCPDEFSKIEFTAAPVATVNSPMAVFLNELEAEVGKLDDVGVMFHIKMIQHNLNRIIAKAKAQL